MGVGLHLLSYPRAGAGGLGTYERMLARHLPEAAAGRADVVLFTGRDGEPVPATARHVSRLPLASRAVRLPYEQLGVPWAGRRHRLDVFHFCDQVASLVPPAPATVVTLHDLAMFTVPETFGRRRARYKAFMTRRAAASASLMIAVSGATAADATDVLGIPPERVRVVPLGVDSRFFAAGEDAIDEARRRVGVEGPYLLYVGRIEPRKNLPLLIEAYAAARRQGMTAPLLVAGAPSWLVDDLPARAETAGVGESVRFLGHLPGDALPGFVAGATALVYPSRYEGFGLPVLEAMAAGTAVVTSTVSSLPEVAGDAALLVDPDDLDALAEALVRVVDDAQLRDGLVAAGRRRAAGFTWARTAELTVGVYEEAAALR